MMVGISISIGQIFLRCQRLQPFCLAIRAKNRSRSGNNNQPLRKEYCYIFNRQFQCCPKKLRIHKCSLACDFSRGKTFNPQRRSTKLFSRISAAMAFGTGIQFAARPLLQDTAANSKSLTTSRSRAGSRKTLGQLEGRAWRLSHRLVGAYRVAAQVAHEKQIWFKRLVTPPEEYAESRAAAPRS